MPRSDPRPRTRSRQPISVAFGKRVRTRREVLGLSQRVLAEKAGMDWSYVAQAERGERNIALANMARLAIALEVDLGDLLQGLQDYLTEGESVPEKDRSDKT